MCTYNGPLILALYSKFHFSLQEKFFGFGWVVRWVRQITNHPPPPLGISDSEMGSQACGVRLQTQWRMRCRKHSCSMIWVF